MAAAIALARHLSPTLGTRTFRDGSGFVTATVSKDPQHDRALRDLRARSFDSRSTHARSRQGSASVCLAFDAAPGPAHGSHKGTRPIPFPARIQTRHHDGLSWCRPPVCGQARSHERPTTVIRWRTRPKLAGEMPCLNIKG